MGGLSMEWKEVTLGDFMQCNPKRTIKKGQKARKITMDLLIPHSKTIRNWNYEPYSGGAKFQNGDTIMARITPCLENGKHAFVSILDEGEIAYGSTEYFVFCGKEKVSDNDFVYYLTKTPLFRDTAIKSMVGSSGRQRAQMDVLENLKMFVPKDISDQRRIASILSSLDRKIELNNKINADLEEMAQAIFKNWFVDFEPFKDGKFVNSELGMIPEGWKVGSLGDFCNVFTGKKNTNQAIEKGLYPFFSCAPEPLASNDAIFNGKAIIIAGNGSYTGRTSFYNGGFDLYQRTYACTIREQDKENLMIFFYHMMKQFFEPTKMGGTRGSSIPYIVMGDITQQKFPYSKDWLIRFSNIANSMMDRKLRIDKESSRLSLLRDTLLPRLMSGELEVSE